MMDNTKGVIDSRTITIKTLTPIWTGGVGGRCDRLHETGIIGSLRWWYEAIVRGLGGYACDPTDDRRRCELSGKEKTDAERRENLCPACYLFGCGGWRRKFKLELRADKNGNIGDIITGPLDEIGKKIWMRFVILNKIYPEEYTLLVKTIESISKYGSVGGKTVFKPSENPKKNNKLHHQDFGLIQLEDSINYKLCSRDDVSRYLYSFKQPDSDPNWPNFNNFWFVHGKVLNRKVHNQIVNRPDKTPTMYSDNATNLQRWLGGTPQKDSKKIISFHSPSGKRTWGYARNTGELEEILNGVRAATGWSRNDFKKGEVVLNELFQ